ncbi:MAG: ANTAR domain-containing protein [Oscillospiraceae bacterium]|nr:ANTAR domain-containing protein [Oscillospiraceae bacterium]
MENALIVSRLEKGTDFFKESLNVAGVSQITALVSCGEARRLLVEREFDLVIVNAPLQDESGEKFARFVAAKNTSQVILVVKSEFFDAVSAACEGDGVLTISKPLNKSVFWSALSLAKSALIRIKRMQSENLRLVQKIEDIRIVDRAKCMLISYTNMDESEAHRYIGKQAMDMRCSKREVAEGILKTYES